jgi:hypothetical protein
MEPLAAAAEGAAQEGVVVVVVQISDRSSNQP